MSARIAASAARSAAVTGSKRPTVPLLSMLSEVRKNGRITSPDFAASSSTKLPKSTAVMECFPGPSRTNEAAYDRQPRWGRRAASRSDCVHFATEGLLRRGRRNRDLPFVRRGGILLQRGIAIVVAFPPPSLGVSSLDLGRLHPRAALFLPMFSPVSRSGRARRAEARTRTASPRRSAMRQSGCCYAVDRVRDRRHSAAAR